MAYKATQRKPAIKKPATKDAPDELDVPASPISVDDLIGGGSQPAAEVAPASTPIPAPLPVEVKPPPSVAPPQQQPTQTLWSNLNPSPAPQGGGNYGGNRGGYNRGGGGQHRPMRREYNNNNNQNNRGPVDQNRFNPVDTGYTQDINVPTETVNGILDVMPEGHGFLRPKFTPSERDVYISQSQIRRFLLRNGDMVQGQARPPKDNERYWGLLKVERVNEMLAEDIQNRAKFEDLVPIYPNKQILLETGQFPLSTRIVDLVAPIGFGQRGLVVSPPKAGKTTMLKELAAGITANYPNVHLMAALIGERPEEVTDITRSVKGEVLASNFDESPAEQTRIAEVALDRARRLVEMGKDVVILLDSITRLARAYNLVVNPSGRTLSGGFDPAALYPAKRFLGAARCVEPQDGSDKTTGGSLTVIGTALVETGSRMDDLIYEEFKGTGNMELHLSRALQERRVFPAIDIARSGTRHDELLLGEDAMKKVTTLRHMLSLLGEEERTVMLIDRLSKTKTNAEFLESLSKGH